MNAQKNANALPRNADAVESEAPKIAQKPTETPVNSGRNLAAEREGINIHAEYSPRFQKLEVMKF